LLNLIGNAIKFTRNGADRAGGRPARPTARFVEFRVIDTGIGIDEADQARVFDDFVTLDTSYSRAVGGTGLGLAIVKRLVDALGGEVGLESAPGDGSLFRVRLPLPAS
jgi:signal transduction histidine kinase